MTKADKVRSATVQNRIVKTVVYCILTVYAFILLFPFYIILISALRPSMESYNVPFLYYIREFDVTGFVEIFTVDIYGISFVRSFFNTLLYVIPPTVVGLLVSAIAGFAFSKLRFPGKNVIFYGLLMTMMIPGTVTTRKMIRVGRSMTAFFHRLMIALRINTQTQTRMPANAWITTG